MQGIALALFLGVLFGGIGWVILQGAKSAARKAELIESTPTTPVERLTPGFREAKGRVASAGVLCESPLSQKPCVYYRFVVKESRTKRSNGKSRTEWVTVVNDTASSVFELDDGTGVVRVDPKKAELSLKTDRAARSGFLSDAPPKLESLLQTRYGRSSQGWIFNKSMRYEETILEPGDPVYVLGQVSGGPDSLGFLGGGELFLVSDGTQEALLASYRSSATWSRLFGYLLLTAAAVAPLVGLARVF